MTPPVDSVTTAIDLVGEMLALVMNQTVNVNNFWQPSPQHATRPFRRNTICRWNDARRMHLGITSGKDVDKAAALEKAVTSRTTSIHRFVRNSAYYQDRPPIDVTPGSQAILTQWPEIIIHDITDRGEQDRVIAAVQATIRDQKLKQVGSAIHGSRKLYRGWKRQRDRTRAATQAGLPYVKAALKKKAAQRRSREWLSRHLTSR